MSIPIHTINSRNTCTAQAPGTVSVGGTSIQLLAANTNRAGVWLTNVSNKTMFIAFGTNAAEKDKGIRIANGERVQIGANMLANEKINVIASGGNNNKILYQEFIIT